MPGSSSSKLFMKLVNTWYKRSQSFPSCLNPSYSISSVLLIIKSLVFMLTNFTLRAAQSRHTGFVKACSA